jgi:NADH-quinone oxidoreductase subunit J
MIGAIVLTHRSRGDARGQNISRQVDRKSSEAVRNMQPQSGEGMTL